MTQTHKNVKANTQIYQNSRPTAQAAAMLKKRTRHTSARIPYFHQAGKQQKTEKERLLRKREIAQKEEIVQKR